MFMIVGKDMGRTNIVLDDKLLDPASPDRNVERTVCQKF